MSPLAAAWLTFAPMGLRARNRMKRPGASATWLLTCTALPFKQINRLAKSCEGPRGTGVVPVDACTSSNVEHRQRLQSPHCWASQQWHPARVACRRCAANTSTRAPRRARGLGGHEYFRSARVHSATSSAGNDARPLTASHSFRAGRGRRQTRRRGSRSAPAPLRGTPL